MHLTHACPLFDPSQHQEKKEKTARKKGAGLLLPIRDLLENALPSLDLSTNRVKDEVGTGYFDFEAQEMTEESEKVTALNNVISSWTCIVVGISLSLLLGKASSAKISPPCLARALSFKKHHLRIPIMFTIIALLAGVSVAVMPSSGSQVCMGS